MSSAIKARIHHQAALSQIDEMHRRATARTRVHIPAEARRRRTNRRSLVLRVRSLQRANSVGSG